MGILESAEEFEGYSLTKKMPDAALMGISSKLCSDLSFLWICPERRHVLSSSNVRSLRKERFLLMLDWFMSVSASERNSIRLMCFSRLE